MDKQAFLNLVVNVLIPAVWASSGPLITTAVTAWINSIIGTYVPRSVQVVLAGIMGSLVTGITAPQMGIDPGLAAGIGFTAGTLGQTAISLDPKTWLASAKETTTETTTGGKKS